MIFFYIIESSVFNSVYVRYRSSFKIIHSIIVKIRIDIERVQFAFMVSYLWWRMATTAGVHANVLWRSIQKQFHGL